MRTYHVYILSSHSRCIYIGITNDLVRRLVQHKRGLLAGYTKQYHVTHLVYFESCGDVITAITREKQLKRWPRWRKERLIAQANPPWADLSADWGVE